MGCKDRLGSGIQDTGWGQGDLIWFIVAFKIPSVALEQNTWVQLHKHAGARGSTESRHKHCELTGGGNRHSESMGSVISTAFPDQLLVHICD